MKISPLTWMIGWMAERAVGQKIDPDQNFYEAKILDSFAYLELLSEIEQTFSVRLEFNDLREESAKTLRGLASLVASKQKSGS